MEKDLLKRHATFFAILFLSLVALGFTVLVFFQSPSLVTQLLAASLVLLTLVSLYFNTLGAYYFLKAYNLKVKPSELKSFPSVALAVASFNEEPEMVKKTLESLKGMDYPKDKLGFYLVDDSTDKEVVRELSAYCRSNGWDYVHRENRKDFKGGALNEFVNGMKEEFLAVFDADEQLVDASFLKETLGYFGEDEKLAYVQTIKKFAEGSGFANAIDVSYSFFFNFVQPVRSAAGFSMFCGSCGVLRASVLRKLGGFPASVTEDVAYSLLADASGYNGVYVPKVYALGKPIESFTAFGAQQWRYNFGNTKLFYQYVQMLAGIPLKKHVHYIAHIFGLHYLSVILILFGLITLFITFSEYRIATQALANALAPQLSLKVQVETATIVSILATFLSALIISKVYFNSFKHGFIIYFMNFGIAFVRARAAVSALLHEHASFKVLKKQAGRKYGVLEALRVSVVETSFAALFLCVGVLAFAKADIAAAFWLTWYGVLFSTSFVFTYKCG
ncbi:glycosyltransferase [Candidatus Micrarchaeota archaeon]|nr:glycosyltransferase [Candidatus Micrarchaeota archaeon]